MFISQTQHNQCYKHSNIVKAQQNNVIKPPMIQQEPFILFKNTLKYHKPQV